jgi:hypothetical protein
MAADRAELEQLIRKADAAGDSSAVRVLFDEMDKLDASPPVNATPFPETQGGAGGYNPMLGRLGGLAQSMGSSLGMTPDNVASPMANASAPLEVAGQAATGGLGMVAGGLAGLGQGAWNAMVPKSMEGPSAGNRVEQVQQALTYQPRTGAGAGASNVVSAPGAALSAGTTKAGEFVADKTGSPALGAAIKTAGDIAPGVVGARMSGAKRPVARPKESYAPQPEVIPTTAELSQAATAAYKRADESGIAMKAESFEAMKSNLLAELQKDGLDPTLHPKATAAVKRIADETGPLTLQKAETLRRIANDAMDTLEKSDARKSGQIVDAIDDYIDNLKDEDLVSGNAKDAAALKEARALYTRKRKAEDIERLIERAKESPSGFENGLRIEFRSLVKNDRKFKRYSKEEQAAIRRVSRGEAGENALRLLGKMAPTGIVSGGLGVAGGAAIGGPLGAIGVPLIGAVSRKAAERMTRRNAERAAMTMRRGPSTSGLLTKDNPTPLTGGPQAGLAGTAAQAPAKARMPRRMPVQIQAEIRRLSERAQYALANEPANSPKIQAMAEELARLRTELAATQADQ